MMHISQILPSVFEAAQASRKKRQSLVAHETCGQCGSEIHVTDSYSQMSRQFCSRECAFLYQRGRSNRPDGWKRGTSLEKADAIVSLLQADPNACRRFKKLMWGRS